MFKKVMDFLSKILKKEKGFTLIELLATLVIIGVIAAIAVPSIGNAIDNSKDKAKVADALMIIDAAKMARAENPDITTWKYTNNLDKYLDKAQDTSWTVTWTEADGYKITGHDAAKVLNASNTNTTPILEQALVDETNK